MITRAVSPFMDEGSKNFAFNLCIQMKDYKFHLVTFKDANMPSIDNVVYHRIYPNSHILNASKIGLFNKLKLFYKMVLNRKNIDIYHFIFTPEVASSRIARIFLKLSRKKSIQTISTPITEPKLKKCLFADKVVVLSEWTRKRALELGYSNVVKINPGIDLDKFSKERIPLVKERSNLKKNDFVILFPNEYDIKRGTRTFLNIFKRLTSEFPEVKIVFAGRIRHNEDIKEKKFLMKTVNDLHLDEKVIFLERIDYMPELINSSDIVISPVMSTSLKMEIPMVLLESLALEKPIIISDIPPLNEIFPKSEAGIKIRPGDSEALLKGIIKLIKDRNLKNKMGKKGRILVEKRYNIKSIAKEYKKIYEELK